jgi:acetyl esterase/lipase
MGIMRWGQARLVSQGSNSLVRFRNAADLATNLIMRVPNGIEVKRDTIGSIPGDWLIPDGVSDKTVILFLHGGSAAFPWGNPHRRMVAYLSKFADLQVFGVDYRLAPEHIYPAAHDDCYAVYKALIQQGKQVVLVGESSGGLLALAILLRARAAGLSQPKLCCLISPLVDSDLKDRRLWLQRDVFAHPMFVIKLTNQYIAGNHTKLPDLGPIHADLSGLAPLYILVGEREILRSDADLLMNAVQKYDLEIDLVVWPDVWHAWHILVPQLPEATKALKVLGERIKRCYGD